MKRKALLLVCAVLVLSLGLFISVTAQETTDNVVDIIARDDNFSTLHEAIVTAEMADRLALASSSYTIFAPRDAAFAALNATSPGFTDSLLADPEGDLTSILNYHVVPGKYMSEDLLEAGTVTNAQGGTLTFTSRDGVNYVNGAQLLSVDIPAKNGVIHIIDSVLLPATVTLPEVEVADDDVADTTDDAADTTDDAADDDAAGVADTGTTGEADTGTDDTADTDTAGTGGPVADTGQANSILDTLKAAGTYSNLVSALEATGLDTMLANPGPYTLFAPTDAAFEDLGMSPTVEELRTLLLFHLVNDTLTRDQLATDSIVPTMEGRPLLINRNGPNIVDIHGANVETFNIEASNGIIHVVDTVIIP